MSARPAFGASKFVKSGDARIHYVTAGDPSSDDTLVFLSGAGTDHSIWTRQVPAFAESAFIIAIDHRGSGLSDRPDYSYTMRMMLSDVEAVVDAEERERLVLIGYSMGGLISQKFLDVHPSRVAKLVLLNCTLGGGVPDIVLPGREVLNIFLFSAAMVPEDVVQAAIDFHFGEGFEAAHPEEAALHRQMFERNALGIYLQVPVLVSNEPLIEDYGTVATPILGVFARQDVVTPPENAEVLKRYLPHAEVVFLDGHHASMVIHPEEINRLIGDFIES